MHHILYARKLSKLGANTALVQNSAKLFFCVPNIYNGKKSSVVCTVFSHVLSNTIKNNTKKFQASSTKLSSSSTHKQLMPSMHTYSIHKVKSHISPLLKVFTLLCFVNAFLHFPLFMFVFCFVLLCFVALLLVVVYVLHKYFCSVVVPLLFSTNVGFFISIQSIFVWHKYQNVSSKTCIQ